MDIKIIAVGSRPWQLLLGYWGLSVLIDGDILFDTFYNYKKLSKKLKRNEVELDQLKSIIISHDHWDHTGGLWGLLESRHGLDVYLPSRATNKTKKRVNDAGAKLIDLQDIKQVKPAIYVSNELDGSFSGGVVAEHNVVIKADKGLVVLVGCAHPGIVEIIQKIKKDFDTPIYGVMGGFHLMNSSAKEITACANALKAEGLKMVAPTHCTGWRAEIIMKRVFKDGFLKVREGQTISL